MKTLSRDAIQRMTGRGTSGNGGGGGGGSVDLTGYATESWVNENYLSIEFFSEVLRIHIKTRVVVTDPSTTPATVISDTTTDSILPPNETIPQSTEETDPETGYITTTTVTMDSTQSILGLWTNSYLSALGQNSSGGGGGGGSSTLAGLNDVQLGTLSANDVLTYDGSGHWVNTPKSTLLSGYATQQWVQNQNYLTMVGWDDINPRPSTLSGFGIDDVKFVEPTSLDNIGIQLGNSTQYVLTRHQSLAAYLTKNDASYTYLSKSDAQSTYLTQTDAASTYLTISHAASTYLTQTNAASTYLSKTDAASTYLSISFFSRLFKAYGGSTEVTPNDTTSTIDNIKAMFGFWTEQYLSALGQNSSGGGGSTTLSGLLDVELSSPQTGQVLMYNGTTSKWYNGTVQQSGGTVTSITAGTGLSGGTITGSGTIAINSTYQSYISHGETAYGWGDHALAGYATQQWVGQQGFLTGITSSMVTSALGYTPLSIGTTFWGQSEYNGAVTGSLSNVGSITMSGDIYMDSGKKIVNNQKTLLDFDGTQATLGYGFRTSNPTSIYGTNVVFYAKVNNVSTEIGRFTSDGLRIGNGVLVWDDANNSLKLQKYDGTSANFYALGGVSALGLSTGSSGMISVDLVPSQSESYSLGSATNGWKELRLADNDEKARIYINDEGSFTIDPTSEDTVINGQLNCGDIYSSNISANRYYFDSSRYLFIDSTTTPGTNVLKYFDGTTSKTVVLQ